MTTVKYYNRYESHMGTKTTESLIDSFLMLFSKKVGLIVSFDDVKDVQKELKEDNIINKELSTFNVTRHCGVGICWLSPMLL